MTARASNNKTLVLKFGGTSVESAEAIDRLTEIVRAQTRGQGAVVVVSAMGKTTNRLLAMAEEAVSGCLNEAAAECVALHSFHRDIAQGLLNVDEELRDSFGELEALISGLSVVGELTPRATDMIASYGERLSSLIVAGYLNRAGIDATYIDAREVIVTDGRHLQAVPNFKKTNQKLKKVARLAAKRVVVMGGFIASAEDGTTTTLGRGGSDYTASIVGAGIGASEIQIWTDVDGMLTADPRIFEGGHRVRVCSFAEAAELAYFGSKVLHPATVLPAIEHNIPVRILNSRRPEGEGTKIVKTPPATSAAKAPVRSIASKRGITMVNIVSTRMLMAHGFLRRIFEVFDRYETPVDMLATSEVSVSLTIDNTHALEEIRQELSGFAEVTVRSHQAIICLVGENIRKSPDMTARTFRALDGIHPRMVSQGASQLNLSLVVDEKNLQRAVALLHGEFFRESGSEKLRTGTGFT